MAPLTPVLVLVLAAAFAAASTGSSSSLAPSHEDYAIVNFFRRVFGISSNDEVPVRVPLLSV